MPTWGSVTILYSESFLGFWFDHYSAKGLGYRKALKLAYKKRRVMPKLDLAA